MSCKYVHATLLYCHDLCYIVLMTACNFLSKTGQNFYPFLEKLVHNESLECTIDDRVQRVEMTFRLHNMK